MLELGARERLYKQNLIFFYAFVANFYTDKGSNLLEKGSRIRIFSRNYSKKDYIKKNPILFLTKKIHDTKGFRYSSYTRAFLTRYWGRKNIKLPITKKKFRKKINFSKIKRLKIFYNWKYESWLNWVKTGRKTKKQLKRRPLTTKIQLINHFLLWIFKEKARKGKREVLLEKKLWKWKMKSKERVKRGKLRKFIKFNSKFIDMINRKKFHKTKDVIKKSILKRRKKKISQAWKKFKANIYVLKRKKHIHKKWVHEMLLLYKSRLYFTNNGVFKVKRKTTIVDYGRGKPSWLKKIWNVKGKFLRNKRWRAKQNFVFSKKVWFFKKCNRELMKKFKAVRPVKNYFAIRRTPRFLILLFYNKFRKFLKKNKLKNKLKWIIFRKYWINFFLFLLKERRSALSSKFAYEVLPRFLIMKRLRSNYYLTVVNKFGNVIITYSSGSFIQTVYERKRVRNLRARYTYFDEYLKAFFYKLRRKRINYIWCFFRKSGQRKRFRYAIPYGLKNSKIDLKYIKNIISARHNKKLKKKKKKRK